MGMPALPIAAMVETKIHVTISIGVYEMPLLMETKSTVIKIKAAHPFMLMVVQSGNVKPAIFLEIFKFSSAHRIAIGKAAADDFVKNARDRAGSIPLAVLMGEIFLNFKKRGSTIKPWIKFAMTTQAK